MTVREFINALQENFSEDLDYPIQFIFSNWDNETNEYIGFDLVVEELESTWWKENGQDKVECHVCLIKDEEEEEE